MQCAAELMRNERPCSFPAGIGRYKDVDGLRELGFERFDGRAVGRRRSSEGLGRGQVIGQQRSALEERARKDRGGGGM